jgi:hypothetical protein
MKDNRVITKGNVTRKYHISPSPLSTFPNNTQKIKKCIDSNATTLQRKIIIIANNKELDKAEYTCTIHV